MRLITFFFSVAFLSLGCTTKGDIADRSVGTKIDDRFLEGLIKRELSKKKSVLKGSNINVTVFDSQVLLTGQVPNRRVSELAENIAISLSKVKTEDISNHLKVMGPISLVSRSNDRWLRTKVRTRLFSSKKANGSSLRVTCENGTVFLMGRVTREESELITSVVSEVFGVEKIVKVFTYL
jgi:osmotically-inducible protein OsmY